MPHAFIAIDCVLGKFLHVKTRLCVILLWLFTAMGLGRNRHSPIGATGLKLLGFFGGSLDELGGLCGAVGVGGDHDVESGLRSLMPQAN